MSLSVHCFPDLDFDSLVSLWQQSLLDANVREAEMRLSAIEEEWQYREVDIDLEAEFPWESAGDTPSQGMLSLLGYNVGITCSQSVGLRHKILQRLVSAKLPIVHPQSYMSEWGAPETRKRKAKIVSTICRFIEEKSKYNVYQQAILNWIKDLKMIELYCHSSYVNPTREKAIARFCQRKLSFDLIRRFS